MQALRPMRAPGADRGRDEVALISRCCSVVVALAGEPVLENGDESSGPTALRLHAVTGRAAIAPGALQWRNGVGTHSSFVDVVGKIEIGLTRQLQGGEARAEQRRHAPIGRSLAPHRLRKDGRMILV